MGAGELALIRRLRARVGQAGPAGVRLGVGDDCALLRVRPGEELAVTTDFSIEGRHFRLDWHAPEAVGHRTLARGLSDLAAMGARPVAAFLSLGLPRALTGPARGGAGRKAGLEDWFDRFLDGLIALAETYKAPLAGGDLAECPVAVADIVLIGAVARGKALLRSSARPGDLLYVTGSLGGAAAGIERLAELAAAGRKGRTRRACVEPPRIPDKWKALLAPHLYPQPRVAQGLWLARRGWATAAIDLSDGLSTDLRHVCEESGVSAELDAASIPVAAGARLEQALHGGEDYELLFTAAPGARVPRRIGGIAVTRIGRMGRASAGAPSVVLAGAQGKQPLEARGWEHFAGA
jgi:thiamine-monophosphate kinase